jgi:hypothetical protein
MMIISTVGKRIKNEEKQKKKQKMKKKWNIERRKLLS